MSITPAWVDITARDSDRLRSFYAEALGWAMTVDEESDYGLVVGPDGRPAGGIGSGGAAAPTPGIVVYFPVEDVDAAVDRVRDAGGRLAAEPWELPGLGRMAVVEDPDGNRIGVMTVPAGGAG